MVDGELIVYWRHFLKIKSARVVSLNVEGGSDELGWREGGSNANPAVRDKVAGYF